MKLLRIIFFLCLIPNFYFLKNKFRFKTSLANSWNSYSKLSQLKIDFNSLTQSTNSNKTELYVILKNAKEISFHTKINPQTSTNEILCASIKYYDSIYKIGFIIISFNIIII